MSEAAPRGWTSHLPWICTGAAWAVVLVVNRLPIPESLSPTQSRYFVLTVLAANLAVVAVCIDLAVGSISRWRMTWANCVPLFLVVGYVGSHVATRSRFFIGIYHYLGFIGAAQ